MIGTSMITRGGIPQGLVFAEHCGCTAAQLYVAPSRAWAVPPLSEFDRELFGRRWAQGPVSEIVAHASLLLNLASPNFELWRRSTDRLVAEVDRCLELGISKIVFHPGSNADKDEAIQLISKALNEVAKRTVGVTILIENMAGQGNTLGSRFEEIAAILALLEQPSRFGLCLDTCHAFAAGYDLRGLDGYFSVMDAIEKIIPLTRIGTFHVNDSKVELGRRVDRHAEIIGGGHIGIDTFAALMSDERFYGVPMIAEVPNGEITSAPAVALLHELRAGHVPARSLPLQSAFQL